MGQAASADMMYVDIFVKKSYAVYYNAQKCKQLQTHMFFMGRACVICACVLKLCTAT